ncbi:hypothetical protein BATDEDRAFT_86854 [Batrachochytrium dendrobatidis JAM81]|uniref:Endoplasmic reticulum vesicle transporter C-terminal domain-containing protein n=2 Tax=Batrachochytrium dendrobatidis TaxID=109871 RepID=F4NZ02_BATDJ|nr:uncharacterized protein BATDEDRAFT_86854 [Batrachochytrium dendrobatidis JAM81]EGF81798.1 hypothetical protein BATDEDRAFT_86854 [Batrachochytrium dendrobatidis JAM81]KAJ8324713.1 hypothetical protein O5D80_006954 [Batrachochytrium dendrobatidis]KAK5670961.1 hypothetical protein QVD99_002732 [Batrachochytrium dendrobatidis]OAJ40359.1 hypothetical protein BDEG_24104 [Batrachochytrium dendrobatidis JEL423]|eukprot:XP_006677535.1 hypothetical protein BATDEDRAFT_86854 [Batrachochytrium dendrobatidis JAM81]
MTESIVTRRLSKRLASLDAFPKIEKQLQQTTKSGGLVSLMMLAVLVYLACTEIYRWRSIDQRYDFIVDQTRSHEHSLQINVDLTIAMDCKVLRADIQDISRTSLVLKDAIHATPTVFRTQGAVKYTREHNQYIAQIHKGLRDSSRDLEDHASESGTPDACRFRGSFQANKVEGMLHFTALGHGYFGVHTPHDAINFTHRIDELSFGARYPDLHNPLDHTLEIGTTNFDSFMYFLGVVPTIYVDKARSLFGATLLTNQYAVTEFSHAVDPQNPDALPGIFIKYHIEPISVRITESRLGLVQFTTRMCGIIGGAFVTIGAILGFFRNVRTMLSAK